MFSKRTLLILFLLTSVSLNAVILFFSLRHPGAFSGAEEAVFPVTAPFQELANMLIDKSRRCWRDYFYLVSVGEENLRLKKELGRAEETRNRCTELELANQRFRNLLRFRRKIDSRVLAAEVIGKDPSPWYRSIIINKGEKDGLRKSFPVLVPEGVVGVVTNVSAHYARVLLLVDRNSAVDALVQKSRARGIVRGDSAGACIYEYVLLRHEVEIGDTVVSSGLDGVFPKGLRVGEVTDVVRRTGGIFQEIKVKPYADFEKLEEVIVVIHHPPNAEVLP